MIVDITNEVLTVLKTELTGVNVMSSYQSTVGKFPTVIIEEDDNSDHINTKDSSGVNHSNIGFTIEIYTTGNKRMSEAKKLRNQIDSVMSDRYGLRRNQPVVIPNYLDNTIYRYKLNYTGLISKNKTIYGR